MITVAEIKAAIDKLSVPEREELRKCLDDAAEAAWDRQIADDVACGRLDSFLAQARAQMKSGDMIDDFP